MSEDEHHDVSLIGSGPMHALTDEPQSCYILPYAAHVSNGEELNPPTSIITHPASGFDVEDGFEIRLRCCRAALKRCLDRMEGIMLELREHVVQDAHNCILQDSSERNVLMPFLEIPSILISGHDPGLVRGAMQDLSLKFESNPGHNVVHLQPADCANLTSAVKTLVGKVLKQTSAEGNRASLSSSALSSLRELATLHSSEDATRETLIIFFYDVELFDVNVLQELLNTCRLYADEVSFIYCFGTSARSDFLRLFFDPDFEPLVILGPTALDMIIEGTNRYNSSADFLRSTLRLIHTHHFVEPLTTVCIDEKLNEPDRHSAERLLDHSDSRAFRERLLACTVFPEAVEISSVELLDRVAQSRTTFYARARQMRLAFTVLEVLMRHLCKANIKHKTLELRFFALAQNATSMHSHPQKALLGTAERISRRAIPISQWRFLCEYATRPGIKANVVQEKLALKTAVESAACRGVAESLGLSLSQYFSDCFEKLDDLPLFNVWSTGHTSSAHELLNANPRAATLMALQASEDIGAMTNNRGNSEPKRSDASVLFSKYLDAGKLVNIHDWYQSFTVGLERGVNPDTAAELVGEDENDADDEPMAKRARRRTVSRSPGKAASKVQGKAAPAKRRDGPLSPEEWEKETQARFLRAFHELEYLGVLRQTRRKAEHVQKTVFDAPELAGEDDGF
ncbi:hypothetical protein BKA62DRAFT_668051 [Auriculariales sp. MPI-PUGE-AT-0066]|nr:hypothetical protein BKA62DRAFT_668051 [Auriculariales sp. MPI-PUGE-AT-0066]